MVERGRSPGQWSSKCILLWSMFLAALQRCSNNWSEVQPEEGLREGEGEGEGEKGREGEGREGRGDGGRGRGRERGRVWATKYVRD